MLTVSSACTGTGGTISIEEFLKGNRNEFTIEPKKASGDVLRDVTTASDFTGADIFLTETYFSNGTWYADQGVATYNSVAYTVQSVTFVGSTGPVTLSLSDYMTPHSSTSYNAAAFSSTDDAATVQTAIEALSNVDAVDVTKTSDSNGDTMFLITFLSNL